MDNMKALWDYQKADLALDAEKKRVKDTPTRRQLAKLQALLTKGQKSLAEMEAAIKVRQSKASEFYARAKEYNYQLDELRVDMSYYSECPPDDLNKTEVEKTLKDIERIAQSSAELKNQMLKLDSKVSRANQELQKLFSQMVPAKKQYDELREKYKQETSGKTEALEDFENVKNELERKLAPEALADYKKVKGYRANPVAHCKGGRCGGCRMQLPSGIESQIEAGKKLVHCENCGRILIMLEEDKEEPQLKKKTRAKKTDKKAEPETKAEAQEQEV